MATAERTFDDLNRMSLRRQVNKIEILAQAITNRRVAAHYPLPRLLPIVRIIFSPLLGLLALRKPCYRA